MRRQTMIYAALAATLAATAYLALQPDAEPADSVVAAPLKRPSAPTPVFAPAAASPEPTRRAEWAPPPPAALRAWAPPPPPPQARSAAAAPPVEPEAVSEPSKPKPPAFPYRWIGRLEQDGTSTALLDGPQRSLGVQVGQLLDGQWRVESISHNRMELVWLPTGEVLALNAR